MANLSVVVTEEEKRALHKYAFDNRIKFQPWIRSAVLNLLHGVKTEAINNPQSEAVIKSLDTALGKLAEAKSEVENLARLVKLKRETNDEKDGTIAAVESAIDNATAPGWPGVAGELLRAVEDVAGGPNPDVRRPEDRHRGPTGTRKVTRKQAKTGTS